MGVVINAVIIVVVVVAVALGGGILWGIGHAAGWGGNKRQLNEGQKKPYAYIEEGKATQEAVTKVAQGYVSDGALGMIAQNILSTFEKADRQRKGIFSVLEEQFEKNSLTWDKFSAPVELALQGIVNNAAQIANRMQAFDSAGFQRMDRIDQAGGYDDESVEVQQLRVMRSELKDMRRIQGDNDRLLLELERLQAELANLTGTETDQIIEEITSLAEDTKYYS